MRRSPHLAIVVLAALTALTLLGAAAAIRPPGIPADVDGPREAANRALVQRFYDAANAVIATGDAAPLTALIDPGFIERGLAATAEPDREGLIRRLLAVRVTAADAWLAVDVLATDGDLVIASVRIDGAVPSDLFGLSIDDAWTPLGPIDVFRIERGQIVERWGSVPEPAPVAPVLQVALDVPPTHRALAIARVTLEPGARHVAPARGGPRLVVVDTGAVTLDAIPATANVVPPTSLRAGEHLLLSTHSRFAVQNTGPATAILLDIAIAAPPPTSPSAPPADTPEEGVAVEVLANDLWILVPATSVVLSLGQATLEPGKRLDWMDPAGPVLVHVDAGTVELTAAGSVPWVRSGTVKRSNASVEALLDAGDGTLLDAGTTAAIRAASMVPATILIVTLLPGAEVRPGG